MLDALDALSKAEFAGLLAMMFVVSFPLCWLAERINQNRLHAIMSGELK